MSLCRTLIAGLLAPLLIASICNANMFLNGEYRNGLQSHQRNTHFSVNPATSTNIFLNHAIISRQASPFTGPTYLPPKEFIKCYNGQQCVRKNQCQNGYFAQQLPKIQNCDEETDICCTYRPPPTTTTTTTTQTPFVTCGRDSDCVSPADCKNGEIVAIDYIKKQGSNRCYSPDTCCRMPSTTLTDEGYIFNLPEKQFPLPTNPTVTEQRVTEPIYRPQPTQPQYRPQPTQPQYRPQPTQPPYRPQPTQPAPVQTTYRPQPTQTTQPQTTYRTQPTQPEYRPQPTQPQYRPQPTQPQYRPQPTTQARPTNEYLPPQTTPAPRPTLPTLPPRTLPPRTQPPRTQPTQPAYRPTQPTPAPYRPQPTQPQYRPQPTTQARPTNEYLPPQTTEAPRQETTRPTYRPTQPPRQETTRPTYRPTQPPRQETTRPTYRPTQPPREQPTYRPQPQTTRKPINEYLPPISENEIVRPERPRYPEPLPPLRPQRPQLPQRTERPTYEQDRVPQPSNEKPIFRGEDQLSPAIFPDRKEDVAAPRNYAKCASALVCTTENYCNSIGVISETPINLSPLEAAFRVPLTDCLVAESGAPGKCCRDPNYVDPWPVNLAGVCAQRNKRTKPEGIKDIDANFAEIPWQVMILKESTKSLLCGGAIIGDEFVLTTASCVEGVSLPDVRIKAGEWELGKTEEPLPFQLVGAKSINAHPEYNPATGSNDMAIIRLQKRLEFATHIQPICISDEDPTASEQCITTGWGKQALQIHEEGAIMHVTSTSPLARSDCGADSTGVCSATKFDSCEFDSGSALACGSGSNVRLKGVYGVENACGEGQTVRFIKPDVKWINTAFADRNKPLLLKRF